MKQKFRRRFYASGNALLLPYFEQAVVGVAVRSMASTWEQQTEGVAATVIPMFQVSHPRALPNPMVDAALGD
jgi:hypothetical protein